MLNQSNYVQLSSYHVLGISNYHTLETSPRVFFFISLEFGSNLEKLANH